MLHISSALLERQVTKNDKIVDITISIYLLETKNNLKEKKKYSNMLNQYDWVLKVQNASDTKRKKKEEKNPGDTTDKKCMLIFPSHMLYLEKYFM